MDLRLILERYNTPDSLSALPNDELEGFHLQISNLNRGVSSIAAAFIGLSSEEIDGLQLIKSNILAELKRRDGLPKTELKGTDLPQIQKIRLAEGVKTDMISIIDALCALGCFLGDDGRPMARKKAMAVFGELFEGGVSGFEGLLSQSYNHTTEEKNTAIFDKMKEKIKEKMKDALSRK